MTMSSFKTNNPKKKKMDRTYHLSKSEYFLGETYRGKDSVRRRGFVVQKYICQSAAYAAATSCFVVAVHHKADLKPSICSPARTQPAFEKGVRRATEDKRGFCGLARQTRAADGRRGGATPTGLISVQLAGLQLDENMHVVILAGDNKREQLSARPPFEGDSARLSCVDSWMSVAQLPLAATV